MTEALRCNGKGQRGVGKDSNGVRPEKVESSSKKISKDSGWILPYYSKGRVCATYSGEHDALESPAFE